MLAILYLCAFSRFDDPHQDKPLGLQTLFLSTELSRNKPVDNVDKCVDNPIFLVFHGDNMVKTGKVRKGDSRTFLLWQVEELNTLTTEINGKKARKLTSGHALA